jgi:uncharacterized protein (TIGR03790 family)
MKRLFACMFFAIAAAAICRPAIGAGPKNVLVIVNDNSAVSKKVGAYYAAKRKVPTRNVLHIKCPTEEEIGYDKYQRLIERPVKTYLARTNLQKTVDYLVLTKGVPLKISASGRSIDSMLMCMDFGFNPTALDAGVPNPYYGKNGHFAHSKYGFYLATRLDGYTMAHAKSLVDRALAAKPSRGVFLLDIAPNENRGSYTSMNIAMRQAHKKLAGKGYRSILNETRTFVGGQKGLMGYYSWGSNDDSFDRALYRSNHFLPGAIAETVVSTSARTFRHANEGQSLIADLIEAGVTGVKGYASEPLLTAIAKPEILFSRYTTGYNLAESFYMASPMIFWKDVVVGDPLCAPYAKQK